MKFYLSLICIAIAAIEAQEPPRRCGVDETPRLFQSRVITYDRDLGYYSHGQLSYDSLGRKERFVAAFDPHLTRPQYDELFLYHEDKRFVLDLRTRKCNETRIGFHFHPIEVHENARFAGIFPIGLEDPPAPGLGVDVSVWIREVEEESTTGNLTVSFTSKECVPVSEVFIGKDGKQVIHVHRSFYDVTVGLDDPDVFDIPPECQMKEEIFQ